MTRDAFPDDTTGGDAVRFAARALPADPKAVGEGRRFTGSTLEGWELGPLVDDAELIVTELLSNALRYGMVATPAGYAAPRPALWLGLLRRRRRVLFAVSDHSTAVPELVEADAFAQSGRGLHIVDCLSEAWGWTAPEPDGKAVWAAVSCPDDVVRCRERPAARRAVAACSPLRPLRGHR